jgi:hypothetical protein
MVCVESQFLATHETETVVARFSNNLFTRVDVGMSLYQTVTVGTVIHLACPDQLNRNVRLLLSNQVNVRLDIADNGQSRISRVVDVAQNNVVDCHC